MRKEQKIFPYICPEFQILPFCAESNNAWLEPPMCLLTASLKMLLSQEERLPAGQFKLSQSKGFLEVESHTDLYSCTRAVQEAECSLLPGTQILWLHWYLFNRTGTPSTFLFLCLLCSLFLVSSHPNFIVLQGGFCSYLGTHTHTQALTHAHTHLPKYSSRIQGWHDKLTPH